MMYWAPILAYRLNVPRLEHLHNTFALTILICPALPVSNTLPPMTLRFMNAVVQDLRIATSARVYALALRRTHAFRLEHHHR